MRAKVVSESLEFERGQDPHENLRVGIKGNMDTYFQKYDDIVEEIQKTRAIGQQSNFVDEILPLIPKRIYSSYGWGNIHYAFKEMDLKEYLPIRKVIDKYYSILFESINFERGKDPKKALDIGMFPSYEFNDAEEAAKYVYDRIPFILGTKGIPSDIIYDPHLNNPRFKLFREKYFKKLFSYVEKYIKIKGAELGSKPWFGVNAHLYMMIVKNLYS